MNESTTLKAPDTRSMAMIRTLGIIAMISGLLVVLVFEWTQPAIEANKQAMIERAVFQVIPGATQRHDFIVSKDGVFPASETKGDGITVYAGYDNNGRLRGIAAEAAAQGYQDVIRLLYGYSPDCQCITGIRVLKLSETPGLGDKIITDPDFRANFKALEAKLSADMSVLANAIVTVKHGTKKNPWEIDAISGATISSTAVGKALNDSAQKLLPLLMPHVDALHKREPPRSQRNTKEKQDTVSLKGLFPGTKMNASTSPSGDQSAFMPSRSFASLAVKNFHGDQS